MKNFLVFTVIAFAVYFQTESTSAQMRPVKKPVATATPTVPAAKPVAKAASPAEEFFNAGLKCEAKDYDCQVSNYTKAINLQLNTKAVFQKRAAAYMGRSDYEKAIGDLTKVIELDLNDATGFKDRGKAYLGMRRSSQNIQNAIKDFSSAIDLEPKDIDSYNLRASTYLMLGNTEKASADFDKALSIDPNNADAYLNKANAFLKIKEYDKAIEAYTKVIGLKSANAEAYRLRANAYLSEEKYDLAAKDISKAIEMDPKNAFAYVGRAEIYEKDKKYDEAIKDYSKAIELDPKSASFLLSRAKAYQANKKFDDAARDYTRLIELNPKDSRFVEYRAAAYLAAGNYEKVIDDAGKAIALNPESDEAYRIRNQALREQNGPLDPKTLAGQEQYDALKIANATRIIESNPRNVGAYIARAAAYSSKKLYDKAVADYTRAIELDSKNAEAFTGRGMAYYALANDHEYDLNSLSPVLLDLRTAVSLNPQSIDAYSALGDAAFKAVMVAPDQNWASIADIYSQAIASNPDNAYFYCQRGNYEVVLQKPDQAVADMTKGLELFSSNATDGPRASACASQLANQYRVLKDNAKALEVLDTNVSRYPKTADSYYARGSLVVYVLGTGEKAVPDLVKAIELDPNNAEYYHVLALAYFKMKNTPQALYVFNKAIELNPDNPVSYINRGVFYGSSLNDSASAMLDYNKALEIATATNNGAYKKLSRQLITFAQESIATQKQDAAEARQRKNVINAALGNAVIDILGAITKKSQSTSTPTQQTTRPSTTNPTSGNGSKNGELSNGRGRSSRAHIYDITADNSLDDKCSSGNAEYPTEHCWGPWEQVAPQVQIRGKGPMAWKGTLGDPNKTVYYEWAFQAKNLTNSPVCMKAEFTHGDGKKGNLMPCMVPGGTQEFRGGEALTTSYPTQTLSVRSYDFEVCSNFKKNSERSYTCIAWPDEPQK